MDISGLRGTITKISLANGFAGASGLQLRLGLRIPLDLTDPGFVALRRALPEVARLVDDVLAGRDDGSPEVQADTTRVDVGSVRLGRGKHTFTLWPLPNSERTPQTQPTLRIGSGSFANRVRVTLRGEGAGGGEAINLGLTIVAPCALLPAYTLGELAGADKSDVWLDAEAHQGELELATEPKKRGRKSAADPGPDDRQDGFDFATPDAGVRAGDGEAPESGTWAEAVAASRAAKSSGVLPIEGSVADFLGLQPADVGDDAWLAGHLDGQTATRLRALHKRGYGTATKAPQDVVVAALLALLRPHLPASAPPGWPSDLIPWGGWTADRLRVHLGGADEELLRDVYAVAIDQSADLEDMTAESLRALVSEVVLEQFGAFLAG